MMRTMMMIATITTSPSSSSSSSSSSPIHVISSSSSSSSSRRRVSSSSSSVVERRRRRTTSLIMATKQRAILIALNNNDDDNDINVNYMKDIERNDFTNPNHWRHQSYIDSLENTETSLQSELYKERTGRNFVYRGIVSYDGTRYKGFQKQGEEVMTVQSELERALMQITSCDRELLCLGGAGRTDAGVHAERQIIHFYTKEPLKDEKNCMRAMNRLLHEDVRVLEIAKPHQMFHSRFHAIEKTYRYTIDFGLPSSPFHRTRALSVGYREYDLELIEQACKIFIGTHDFSAFMNRSRDGKNLESNSERTIYSFDVVRGSGLSLSDDGNNNNNNNNNKYDDGSSSLVHLYVTGNGFLYRQVRNMVGAILAVGGGRFSLDELKILMGKRDRKLLPTAAPAKGLCLYDVKYPKEMLYYTEE